MCKEVDGKSASVDGTERVVLHSTRTEYYSLEKQPLRRHLFHEQPRISNNFGDD